MKLAHYPLKQLRLLAPPLILAALILLLAAGGAPMSHAGDDRDPAQAVSEDLSAQGYDVIQVGFVGDDPAQPGAVMTIVSQQLDARVTAQLQDGWTALSTHFPAAIGLHNYLEYQQRYWLIWSISADDWAAWLNGELPSEEFWDYVDFGVWDTVEQEEVGSRDFLDKNFTGKGPPGPEQPVDPSNLGDPDGAVLLDTGSAFVPVAPGAANGTTLLARVSDPSGNRLPRQPVTITVASGIGRVEPARAVGDDNGTARAAYSAEIEALKPVSGTAGVPVEVTAYGAGGPGQTSRVKLLLAAPPGADVQLARQRVTQAMQLQGYKVHDVYYDEYPYPVGNVTYISAGPMLEAASPEMDAAWFQQVKTAIGSSRAAFQNITNPLALVRFPYRGEVYNIWVVMNTSDWDAWVAGDLSEAELWQRTIFDVRDARWRPVGSIDHSCKDFGAGCDEPQRAERPMTVTAMVSEEEWGVQHTFAKIYIPAGNSAARFEAQLEGEAREWLIYRAPEFAGEPIYSSVDDEDGSELADLVLGPGQYMIAVYSDNPPATLIVNYTEFISY